MKNLFAVVVATLIYTQMNAQCYPDRHSTNWYDGWISCELAQNPNEVRGSSHWILYDFGQRYTFYKTHLWNTNDPSHLDWGIREAVIDYSTDGIEWKQWGFADLEKAKGQSNYEGFGGPDLNGIEAQYILITAISNYGGDCFGFSEIRFEAEAITSSTPVSQLSPDILGECLEVSFYPNPFSSQTQIAIQSKCKEGIDFTIHDVMGRIIDEGKIPGSIGHFYLNWSGSEVPPGTYYLSVRQGVLSEKFSLIKIH